MGNQRRKSQRLNPPASRERRRRRVTTLYSNLGDRHRLATLFRQEQTQETPREAGRENGNDVGVPVSSASADGRYTRRNTTSPTAYALRSRCVAGSSDDPCDNGNVQQEPRVTDAQAQVDVATDGAHGQDRFDADQVDPVSNAVHVDELVPTDNAPDAGRRPHSFSFAEPTAREVMEVDNVDSGTCPTQLRVSQTAPVEQDHIDCQPDQQDDVQQDDVQPEREESDQISDGALSDVSAENALVVDDGQRASPNTTGRIDLFDSLGSLFLDADGDDSDQDSEADNDEHGDVAVVDPCSTYMRTLHRRLLAVAKWERMLALLCLDGRGGFSHKQYNTMRLALMERDKTLKIPDARTLNNSIRRTLLQHCYPRSSVIFIHHNLDSNSFSARSTSVTTASCESASPEDCVRLVLPSEWAKLDVCCLSFFRSVFPQLLDNVDPTRTGEVNIEDTLIVSDRRRALHRKGALRARFAGTQCSWHVSSGDIISFPCSSPPGLHDNDLHGWKEWQTIAGQGNKKLYYVEGRAARSFGVGFDEGGDFEDDTNLLPPVPESYLAVEEKVYSELRTPNRAIDSDPTTMSASQRTFPSRPTITDLALYPGDVITILRPNESEITEGICCVFHASPISSCHGGAAERIVWLSLEDSNGTASSLNTAASSNVISMPLFSNSDDKLRDIRTYSGNGGRNTNSGVLPGGERYVLYRVALYCDGFSKNRASTYSKSVAGVYMLPLGLPISERNSAHSVRVLCLTPPGINGTDVMTRIMDDVVETARHGIPGMDPVGRHVRIFIDVVNLLGDYPQVAKYTDILGHGADAMCSLCFVRKRKKRSLPANNYGNGIHSARVGYARFDGRTHSIRQAAPHPELVRILGMHSDASIRAETLPAVYLSQKLNCAAKDISQSGDATISATHPVPLVFDHILSVPAIPDHLLSIMVSNVMTACFRSMQTDEVRRVVEMRIVDAANKNGLDVKHHIANWTKGQNGPKYKSIASNTMSAWMSILLVSAPIFGELHASQNSTVFLLPRKLQIFVTLLYKWPRKVAEGRHSESWDFGRVDDQLRYQHNAAVAAMSFLSAARDEYKQDNTIGGPLDRPMTHRLLELVMSTIPIYGHGLLCSELILEHTHQLFKRWLVQNTHADSHITGMEKAVGRDWMCRLSSLYNTWRSGDAMTKSQAEVGLRRLLMGEKGMRVGGTTRNGIAVSKMMSEALHETMRTPVQQLLLDCDEMNSSLSTGCTYMWSAMWDDQARQFDPMCDGILPKIVETGIPAGINVTDLQYFKRARFMPHECIGPKRSYRYNVVECGEAVSAIVSIDCSSTDACGYVPTVTDGNGDCKYFVIGGIIGNIRTDDVWIVCKELLADGAVYTCRDSEVRYLKLDAGCRRVALVHNCEIPCVRKGGRAAPHHHEPCLQGGRYYILDRACGYPPFQG